MHECPSTGCKKVLPSWKGIVTHCFMKPRWWGTWLREEEKEKRIRATSFLAKWKPMHTCVGKDYIEDHVPEIRNSWCFHTPICVWISVRMEENEYKKRKACLCMQSHRQQIVQHPARLAKVLSLASSNAYPYASVEIHRGRIRTIEQAGISSKFRHLLIGSKLWRSEASKKIAGFGESN